jgi:hypothetical protein
LGAKENQCHGDPTCTTNHPKAPKVTPIRWSTTISDHWLLLSLT